MVKTFSLVLPCYNEEKSLPRLVGRVLDAVQTRGLTPAQFQLVLVENGSKDNSLSVMHELRKGPGGSYLTIVPVSPNRGYGYGLMQGLAQAKTDVVGWSHADEQCDPQDAFRAYALVTEATSPLFVKGKRKGRSAGDRFVSRGFEWLASLIFWRNLREINAQPKVFPRELLVNVVSPPNDFALDLYVLLKAMEGGYSIQEIEVEFPERKYGISNWAGTFRSKYKNILKMIRYMLKLRFSGQ